MTYDQFRNEANLRVEHAMYLRSAVGQLIVSILRDLGRPTDVPGGSDALASARILSQYHGYNAAIDDLVRLAAPPVNADPLPEPNFGANLDLGDLLPSQYDPSKDPGEVTHARNNH